VLNLLIADFILSGFDTLGFGSVLGDYLIHVQRMGIIVKGLL
jgi:hypothetical protein